MANTPLQLKLIVAVLAMALMVKNSLVPLKFAGAPPLGPVGPGGLQELGEDVLRLSQGDEDGAGLAVGDEGPLGRHHQATRRPEHQGEDRDDHEELEQGEPDAASHPTSTTMLTVTGERLLPRGRTETVRR